MAACRAELTVSSAAIAAGDVFVAADANGIVGFHALARVTEGDVDVPMLFVTPECIGRGVGHALFAHLCAESRRRGFRRVIIDSDPHAVGYYERMGAKPAGAAASGSIPGRALPRLIYTL